MIFTPPSQNSNTQTTSQGQTSVTQAPQMSRLELSAMRITSVLIILFIVIAGLFLLVKKVKAILRKKRNDSDPQKTKNSKKVLVLSIAGLILIVGGGLFSFTQFESYQKGQATKQNMQNSEIQKLQEQINTLNNKKPQVIIKQVPAPQNQQQGNDLSSIVKEWRPRIAHVSCEWRYVDDGVVYLWDSGSGLLANVTDTKAGNLTVILTNRHVLQPVENKDTPYSCDISLPDVTSPLKVIDTGALYSFRWSSQGLDYGDIVLYYTTDYMKNLASQNLSICRGKPSVGDELVILGYPSIGSQTDITATEGIISGYDGDYYITSAKVEHGNSGGAAILVKDDCYLGIPSYVDVGTVESLARILSAGAIFGGI